MDIGAFIGHDLRRVAADGAPSENLFALDIVSHWEVGYNMFRDRGRFDATFIEGDILRPNKALKALRRKIEIISITHVLHQWSLTEQTRALINVVSLAKRYTAMVVGFQIGTTNPGFQENNVFLHDAHTFCNMWKLVMDVTKTSWICFAWLREFEHVGIPKESAAWLGEDARVLEFVVVRGSPRNLKSTK